MSMKCPNCSISDVLGTTSTPFENKMEKAKEIVIQKLIIKISNYWWKRYYRSVF